MTDRSYWHVPGARSWHAEYRAGLKRGTEMRYFTALCSRGGEDTRATRLELADRLPSTAHLCGNCARIIAARTDIEERPVGGSERITSGAEDSFEPFGGHPV